MSRRSETAARAVSWAADMAGRFSADLVLVQVLSPDLDTEELPEPRVDLAATELTRVAADIAGPKGRARVVVDDDPAVAILRVAEEEVLEVQEQYEEGLITDEERYRATCRQALVDLETGFHLGGGSLPPREELYDRSG